MNPWRKRRERERARRYQEQAYEGMRLEAIELAHDIEETTAKFGTDRLFDERLRRIEDRALRIRKRAEYSVRETP